MIVYTAISDGYDDLRAIPEGCRAGNTFMAFVENAYMVPPWQTRPLERRHPDVSRDAKIYKILPHRFFPQEPYTLWLDGKLELASDGALSSLPDFLRDVDLAVFEHPLRCCLYQEACQCIHRKLDDRQTVYEQVQRYTREGFPENQGLVDCAALLRRHTPAMQLFNELWWQEISNGSRRDQLSFMYCVWKTKLKFRFLPGFVHQNPYFKCHSHLRPLGAPMAPPPDAAKHEE